MFPRLLGNTFACLPPLVRALHLHTGTRCYRGEVEVERGHGLLAALCIRVAHLPPAGQGPIEVEITADAHGERWARHVAGHTMRSRLWAQGGLLCERLGLVTFGFRLHVQAGHIVWRVVRVRVLGLPLPARWFAQVAAREYEEGGRYGFDVSAALPLAGLLVRYRGWLDVG
ncbi:MAG: DUF4166 domain-containing protein [Dokdonella sp.]